MDPANSPSPQWYPIPGSFPSPEDPDDIIFEHMAQGPASTYQSDVPEEYDMRSLSQPVRDQGQRGTCAAFTATAIREIQECRDSGLNEWMSPEFIYYHRENKPSGGMHGKNVFQILQRIGTVPESQYPYNDGKTVPSKKLYDIAAQYRIANFARVRTIDGLKRALVELGPSYFLLPEYGTRPKFWIPNQQGESSTTHATAVIGYTKEGFILRNSWGNDWNGDGHIVFPFADWGHLIECWVSIDSPPENEVFDEHERIAGSRKKRPCAIL